jgi:hypothetical protein
MADLGDLASTEGPRTGFTWARPSLIGPLAPWLGVLALLLLPANRSGRAWWVWLPLLCVAGMGLALPSALTFLPSEPREILGRMMAGLGFGFAAVLLLAPHIRRAHSLLTLLTTVIALVAISSIALVLSEGVGELERVIFSGIILGASSLALMVAMHLAGVVLRRKYRPLTFSLGTLAGLVLLWSCIVAPFATTFELQTALASVLLAAGINYAIVLPFLMLATFSPLFAERLATLLHLTGPACPSIPLPADVLTDSVRAAD